MDDLHSTRAAPGMDGPLAEALDCLDHGVAVYDPAGALTLANAPFAEAVATPATLAEALAALLGAAEGDGLIQTLAQARDRQKTGLIAELPLPEQGELTLKLHARADGGATLVLAATPAPSVETRDARALFADAIDNVNFGVALIDEAQRLVFANKKFRAHGDPRDELLIAGRSMRQIHRDAIRTGLFPLPEGMAEEHLLDAMDQLIDTNARDFPVPNNHGSALLGNVYDTELGGRVLTMQDVTEDRQAEQLIVGAMSRLPVGVAIEDASGQFTHCNEAFAAPYGLSAADLIAMPPEARMAYLSPQLVSVDNDARAEDLGAAFRAAILQQRETLKPFEVRFKSGQQFLVERGRVENGGCVVVVTDITALKDAETRNLAAVTDAVQTLDIAVVLFDKDLRITFGNEKWAELFSTREPRIRVGDHVLEATRKQAAAGHFVLSEGRTVDEFIAYWRDTVLTYRKDVHVAFSDGRHVVASCHKTRLDGFLVSFIDITEQRAIEAELARQREITHQKERLSALGELLAGVAHELNNPLSIIVGYAQMLEGQIADPVLQRRVDRIAEAANRSAKIVEMFLDMAQERPFEKTPCSVNEIVASALDVAESGLSAETRVEVFLAEDLAPILGDPDSLIQVIYNILINAQQAVQPVPGPGHLRLRSRPDAEGGAALIEIADNGPGIPEALRNRVFEPLFSTKEVGEGTGMGLALCHRIITSHGGSIAITDSDLGGAQFEIRLPIAPPGA
ncbi:PAS-domain containing protein [Dinoroseobacter sp. S124A]|uniref:PAS-domain containing protein n=1 Tax=Dinoroseobacter sp. S124A TaxID=3415128 RepID=UPI003C7D418C